MIVSSQIFLSGCVSFQNHEHALGSIVALDSGTEAHVCMKSSEVKQGEQLSLFQSVCTTKKKKASKFSEATERTTCEKVSKGFVEVVEISSPHFIKVKAVSNSIFEEGYFVEKMAR